ncbi:MAG TPA: hypothetical protein VKT78_03705 [Fimbriimonadaceae bacterium]|nr:hypothetical protein [Fimbriimonadaceae bacterium]
MRARSVVVGAALSLLAGLSPQVPAQGGNLFTSLKVDVSVVVYKHQTGADMVTITVLAPDYPASELGARATEIGNELGSPVRGLNVYPYDNGAKALAQHPFLKADFATNGILEDNGGIRLQPIVRAFMGGKGSALVEGLVIHLQNVKANTQSLSTFESPIVKIQGREESIPPGLEYRVSLKSQDPARLVIPDRMDTQPAKPVETQASGPPAALVWTLVLIGALAAGALVYNLALRGSGRTRRG